MTRFVATIGLSLVFLTFFQSVAYAAECGKRDKVVKFLASKYKEVLVAGGLVSNRGYMEFYASERGKSWTVLLVNTQGIACIVAAGEAFYQAKPKPVEDPEA